MPTVISILSANYVARELGYGMTGGWGEGDAATNDAFRPVETFRERFGGLLDEVADLGVSAIDLWTAYLNRPGRRRSTSPPPSMNSRARA
jgi:hypothetical protein